MNEDHARKVAEIEAAVEGIVPTPEVVTNLDIAEGATDETALWPEAFVSAMAKALHTPSRQWFSLKPSEKRHVRP